MRTAKINPRAAGKVIAIAAACFYAATAGAAAWAGPEAEGAYDHPGTGTIQGVVTVEGTLPKLKPLKINKDRDVCKNVPNEDLIVGPGRGVENVVATVAGAPKGKAPVTAPASQVYKLDNKGCRFVPHVMVMQADKNLEISNTDPILHCVRAHQTQVNVGLYPGAAIQSGIGKPILGPTRLSCAIHPWMRGYVYFVDNPYYAVTDMHGEYAIYNVPPGKYRVKFWQELLGVEVKTVVVTAGKTTNLNVTFNTANAANAANAVP